MIRLQTIFSTLPEQAILNEMIQYNREKPLIALHIPKTAGTSFREVMEQWFGKNLHLHYYNDSKKTAPKKVRIKKRFSDNFREGICIYGHFNKTRGFGAADYYPEIDHFITILRDPFERAISLYFHKKRKIEEGGKDNFESNSPDLENYLKTTKSNYLNQFPFEVTRDDFEHLIKKHFIHIGTTENFESSIRIIAKKLGFPAPENIKNLNVIERNEKVPYELKQEFIDNHQLEFAVYDFAKRHFENH